MIYDLTVADNGRVVLPIALRRELGLERGGKLHVEVSEEEVTLRSKRQMARRAQALARELLKDYKGSMVDELIADRRAEAAREIEEFEQGVAPR